MSDATPKKRRTYETADDAAMAFDYMLQRNYPDANRYEYASAIVPTEDGFTLTEPQTSHQETTFRVPMPRSMDSYIHNHPLHSIDKRERTRSGVDDRASLQDRSMAGHLGKQSYISSRRGVHRYDPETRRTEEVLGQFPIEEMKEYLRKKYPYGDY